MGYKRILLVLALGGDASPAAAIRRVAPDAERLVVVAHAPGHQIGWLSREAPADLNAAAAHALEALREATAGLARNVETLLAAQLDVDALASLAADAGIDLLATAGLPARDLPRLAELRKRLSLPVLFVPPGVSGDGPLREIACVALGSLGRRAVAAFLRDHGSPEVRCTIVGPTAPEAYHAETLAVAGVAGRVEPATGDAFRRAAPDLFVLARLPATLLSAAPFWPAPVLVLPPQSAPAPRRRAVDVADAVDLGGLLRVRITYATGVGRLEAIPDQEVAFVSGGGTIARAVTECGTAEIVAGDQEALGVFRTEGTAGRDPVAAVEQRFAILRPGPRPLCVFDAALPDADLERLAWLAPSHGLDLLAVRLRPVRSCASIRRRLAAFGLPPRVVDATAVLDEGAALDVPEEVDPVRLSRVAARMRGAGGFPVAAAIHRGLHTPSTIGFAALRAGEAAAAMSLRLEPPVRTLTLASRLDATTGAAALAGNLVDLELDNPKARAWLLDAVAGAHERVHFQVYMAADDDVGAAVERALAAAAARGVTVRVVVDSLHGLQGSFGLSNPLLTRLAARPGVQLRVARPVEGPPSLEDLKQRDHRKVVVVDGVLALVGGRNLSHEYYTGFDEVRLSPSSTWREVPWLDAGARVEGPAVEALERSFLDAWTAAGGSPYEVRSPPPAGRASARVVVHHGLRDAATLDAYVALVEAARSRVTFVNGFPLVLELQHALLRAIARGVTVRALVGHTTPTHGETPFSGPWSSARTAASRLVDSRLDALVAAGGEAYRLAVRERPGWEPGLGTVHPHVHAKVVSVDGRVCSVGSANLDVTAGYWENELLLVVEDEAVTRALDQRLDEWIAGSERIRAEDPDFSETARRRAWMRRWPSLLSV